SASSRCFPGRSEKRSQHRTARRRPRDSSSHAPRARNRAALSHFVITTTFNAELAELAEETHHESTKTRSSAVARRPARPADPQSDRTSKTQVTEPNRTSLVF